MLRDAGCGDDEPTGLWKRTGRGRATASASAPGALVARCGGGCARADRHRRRGVRCQRRRRSGAERVAFYCFSHSGARRNARLVAHWDGRTNLDAGCHSDHRADFDADNSSRQAGAHSVADDRGDRDGDEHAGGHSDCDRDGVGHTRARPARPPRPSRRLRTPDRSLSTSRSRTDSSGCGTSTGTRWTPAVSGTTVCRTPSPTGQACSGRRWA